MTEQDTRPAVDADPVMVIRLPVVEVKLSMFVSDTWIAVARYPEPHRLGDYRTQEAAEQAAEAYAARAMAVLRRSKTLR